MEYQAPAKAQAIARWQGAARRAWHDTVRLICTKDKLAVALRDDVGRQANPEVWQQGLNDAMAEVDQDLLALDRTITEAEQELAGLGYKARWQEDLEEPPPRPKAQGRSGKQDQMRLL